MVPSSFPPLPRRERAFVLTGLIGATALAWLYLAAMAADMTGMPGNMSTVAAPKLTPWSYVDWLLMTLMWAVMMVGMMLPSAIPTILLYGAVERAQRSKGRSVAPVGAFVGGYLGAWTVFSIAATAVQWALERLTLLNPMMASASATFGGIVLIAAGIYQLSPLKHRCLEHCRAPVELLSKHWRPGAGGAVVMGFRHGLFCVGCCWVLMALLFVGGVMNLLWVAAITFLVLLEKIAPHGHVVRRVTALLFIAAGTYMLIRPEIGLLVRFG